MITILLTQFDYIGDLLETARPLMFLQNNRPLPSTNNLNALLEIRTSPMEL